MLRLRSRVSAYVSSFCRNFHNVSSAKPGIPKLEQHHWLGAAMQVPSYQPMKKIIQDVPLNNISIESPKDSLLNEIREIIKNERIIESPPTQQVNEIHAARLIVIRRRKMKKHKLKKLRKKMKFEWAKVRQRREMRKEKAFQAGLIAQIKEAEKFSAEQYVMAKLQKANETPIPRYWKGRRLPQFIIKQKLGIQ